MLQAYDLQPVLWEAGLLLPLLSAHSCQGLCLSLGICRPPHIQYSASRGLFQAGSQLSSVGPLMFFYPIYSTADSPILNAADDQN